MDINKQKIYYTTGSFLVMFTGAICTTTQGVMLTNYIDYYQLKSYEQGLMSAFQSGGNLAALFLIGFLQKYLKKNEILLGAAIIIPLVFFMFSMRPFIFIFLVGYALYGIAFGFVDSLASSVMVDLYPEKSSFYMNLLHGIYGVGGLFGPILMRGLQLLQMQWQVILFVIACFALLVALVYLIITIKTYKVLQNHSLQKRIKMNEVIGFLKNKNKRILFICAFFYGAHQIGITLWVARYISEYLQTPQWGAITLSVFWICVAVSRLTIPQMHWQNKKIMILGHMICGIILIFGIISQNGFLMMICTGISGIAEGTLLPLTLDTACHWEVDNTALGSSMILLAHYLGFIITPIVMGSIISRFSIGIGMLLPAFFSLMAAFSLNRIKI